MDHPNHAAAAPRGRAPSGGELAGLGVFLAAAVVLPLLIGAVLDNLIHTAPLLLFVRLLVLTGLGLGIGLLIGLSQVWLVVGGIAVAQLVLAGFAVREALAR